MLLHFCLCHTFYLNQPCSLQIQMERSKWFNEKKFTLSSQSRGKWSTISNGVVSAAIMTSSAIPLFKVFVASFAPFFN